MKKNALVSVSGVQSKKDDNIEVVTPGKFYKKEGQFYVVYDETEISGMEGTTTTFKINSKEGKMSLIRMGSTSTKMEFENDMDNIVLYNTPYGTLELNIHTKKINIDVNEQGGDIFINYDMNISGQKPQNTTLKINIKAQ
ncbi:DUF1934 domain-containing protein [Clostridium rectalis]|uniref:DUF1934 domain-containing protein n=1 Tax=Clostridium rectalis TaxID=2040295 RepID=UPI000F63D89F|nr:DUF1934 domain-containing protein [Clostridium rectalis]